MASSTPKLLLKGRLEDLLNGSSNKAGSSSKDEPAKSGKTKTPDQGLKVTIRRLPPGMTRDEFLALLGQEWHVGNGKVDYLDFAEGKVAKDPAKISRPARVSLHVINVDSLAALEDLVRVTEWKDARGTHNDSCLVGPPALERAIYQKTPTTKKRIDPRQGTIDQDPEFQAFLESLANPIIPNQADNSDDTSEDIPKAKVETTPLIEDLRRKARESAEAKKQKQARQESQSTKASAASASASRDSKKKGKETKVEPKAKEVANVKILRKARSEAAEAAKTIASELSAESSAAESHAPSSSQSQAVADGPPRSRRAGIAAVARMLQKDLGLSPGSAHRKARLDAAKADAEAKGSSSKEKEMPLRGVETLSSATLAASATVPASLVSDSPPSAAASSSKTPPTKARGSRGGKDSSRAKDKESQPAEGPASSSLSSQGLSKRKTVKEAPKSREAAQPSDSKAVTAATGRNASIKNPPAVSSPKKSIATQASGSAAASSSSASAMPAVMSAATRGFIKHANASQGINEQVLKQAMEEFGVVTFLEIDKRKGFAYVDYAESDGLSKAMAASPVRVGQGTVQILERRDKKPASTQGAAAGASGSGSAGGNAASQSSTTASPVEKAPGQGNSSRRGRRGGGGGSKGAGGSTDKGASTTNPATASSK